MERIVFLHVYRTQAINLLRGSHFPQQPNNRLSLALTDTADNGMCGVGGSVYEGWWFGVWRIVHGLGGKKDNTD